MLVVDSLDTTLKGRRGLRFCAKKIKIHLLCDCDALFRRKYLRWGRDRLSLLLGEKVTIERVLGFIRSLNLDAYPIAMAHNWPNIKIAVYKLKKLGHHHRVRLREKANAMAMLCFFI